MVDIVKGSGFSGRGRVVFSGRGCGVMTLVSLWVIEGSVVIGLGIDVAVIFWPVIFGFPPPEMCRSGPSERGHRRVPS